MSVGANTVLSHGRHYWEVVLEKYGTPSLSRKVVVGVVAAGFQQWHRYILHMYSVCVCVCVCVHLAFLILCKFCYSCTHNLVASTGLTE